MFLPSWTARAGVLVCAAALFVAACSDSGSDEPKPADLDAAPAQTSDASEDAERATSDATFSPLDGALADAAVADGSGVAQDGGSSTADADATTAVDAQSIPWDPPAPPRREALRCDGLALSCAARSDGSCSQGRGCTLRGDCSGLPRSCYNQISQYSCIDITGCYWSSSSSGYCSGSARSCSLFSGSSTCIGQPGCYWDTACEGTATSCSLLDSVACGSQPGCSTSCSGGLSQCGSECIDRLDDEQNCGSCGFACGPRGDCKAGRCECGAPYTQCGGRCVDTQSDPLHCGACGHACGQGYACQAGSCVDVDECAKSPCRDGRSCSNSTGGYSCGPCAAGYNANGNNGCDDVNECGTNNGGCDPAAPCVNEPGTFHCGPCPSGYMGTATTDCVDIDECTTNNGGCDARTSCTNTPGGRSCGPCPSGYAGTGLTGCVDIDECATNNGGCHAVSTCTNTPGGRSCGPCPSGYTGTGLSGCIDINECTTNNGGCEARRQCVNDPGTSHCGACPLGYVPSGATACACAQGGAIECGGTCVDPSSNADHCGGCNQHCQLCGGSCQRVTQLVSDWFSTCAIMDTGALYCWGDASGVQSGAGPYLSSAVPARMATEAGVPLNGVKRLRIDGGNLCAQLQTGELYCWGGNNPAVSAGLGVDTRYPTRIELSPGVPLTDAVDFDVTDERLCVVRSNGELHCAGSNLRGSVGDGSNETRYRVVRVETAPGAPLANVAKVELRGLISCAVTRDGAVYCWGANDYGFLGDGSTSDRTRPVRVMRDANTPLTDVVDTQAGCAVTRTGELYCWGPGWDARLGNGGNADSPWAVRVQTGAGAPLGSVAALDIGVPRCVRLTDNTAWCWGNGQSGAMGDGQLEIRTRAVQVRSAEALLTHVSELQSVNDTACAKLTNGQVYCWGWNASGTAGVGTAGIQAYATRVRMETGAAIDDVTQVSAGYQHVCALRANGDVLCWGDNARGQLGTAYSGTISSSAWPRLVQWQWTSP